MSLKAKLKNCYFVLTFRKKHVKLMKNVNASAASTFEGYNVIQSNTALRGV